MNISDELRSRLVKPAFPRASTYDAEWLFGTMMGPNVLWLAEWASQAVPLHRGMRILDLGCGKAASSIFLAKEFDVVVWAADLWIKPTENWRRIEAAGLTDRVLPVHAEAHALPFAEGYFDVVFSFDAYHYFGTDDLYVGYISKFIRPGGYLCIAAPGLAEELPEGPPESLRPYWDWDFCSFHSANWWRRHWSKTGRVEIELADNLADGWRLWAEWNECCAQAGAGRDWAAREAEMLRLDGGQTFAFTRVVAKRPGTDGDEAASARARRPLADGSGFAQRPGPNMRISVEPGEETHEVRLFIDLVWPPTAPAPQSPISRIFWDTSYSQRVLMRADSGRIISQVALIFRDGHWNSTPLRIGGIAGVGTDPNFRGQGLATLGMKRATEILVEEGFDIGALFCARKMVPFYERLGWRRFDGAVFIKQPGNNHMPWSDCMTLAIKRNISGGELDVAGPPW